MDVDMEEEEEEEGEREVEDEVETRRMWRSKVLRREARLVLPKDIKLHYSHVQWSQWSRKHGKDVGTAQLQPYHRAKLRAVLVALIQERCFHAASGVVSVLLQAGGRSDQLLGHRDVGYFWAAMEVLRQVNPGQRNIVKTKRLYRMRQRKQITPKIRGDVQLELALFLMTLGDQASYEASYNEIRPIIDVLPFRNDPLLHLCHGYALYQMWQDRAIKDVEAHFVEDLGAKPQHGAGQEDYEEGGGENDVMEVKEQKEENNWTGALAGRQVNDQESILIEDMEVLEIGGRHFGLYGEDEQDHELDASGDSWRTAVVRWSPDLDRRLFPVRLPQTRTKSVYKVPMDRRSTRDVYNNAIKQFRQALLLDSSMIHALLPLVQLLLAAGNVRGATEEIDKYCNAPHLIPLSIKALLLESIGSKDTSLLSQCYTSILHINPSSSHSLDMLIRLHSSGLATFKLGRTKVDLEPQGLLLGKGLLLPSVNKKLSTELVPCLRAEDYLHTGKYRTVALVECIATHLDVEQGEIEIWQQLAACLLLLNKEWDRERRETESRSYEPLAMIEKTQENKENTNNKSVPFSIWRVNTWAERAMWWRYKHFNGRSIGVEQRADGDWRRIAYKAACSIHIMGLDNTYESTACQALATDQIDLLDLVKHHRASLDQWPEI